MTTHINVNDGGTENSKTQEQTSKEVPEAPVVTSQDQVAVSLLEQHDDDKGAPVVMTYNIEPAYQNTLSNPYKETTITLPHLVKKVPPRELLPRPYRTFNQVLALSYVSIVCCLFIGMFANRYAWRAKIQNGKGLYALAKKWARIAVYVSYVAFVCGILIATFITLNELVWNDDEIK
ncbi:uncharacterized protein LOC132545465 [Ylistrum balloti]|uniref:uncharacterized protein LOC132545465 n=1 Tax=Ylistrum balloti TaxID=509963 RepID=UPI0029059259|nr:uncharacterized protein LOC132545465 [Ylistrum balloti]